VSIVSLLYLGIVQVTVVLSIQGRQALVCPPIIFLVTHRNRYYTYRADWEDLDKDARIFDIAGFTTQIPDGGDTDGLEPTTLDYGLS